jgi:hypothetical protein
MHRSDFEWAACFLDEYAELLDAELLGDASDNRIKRDQHALRTLATALRAEGGGRVTLSRAALATPSSAEVTIVSRPARQERVSA